MEKQTYVSIVKYLHELTMMSLIIETYTYIVCHKIDIGIISSNWHPLINIQVFTDILVISVAS